MTGLDCQSRLDGHFPSAWPAECGGPRRQKLVATGGLGLRPGEALASTVRHTGGWPVLVVQRERGELYLQGGAGLRAGEAPPLRRPDDPGPGWLERVDPVSLEAIGRSVDLPSGGWLWCGGAVVHANGDLYVVNGRFCHRLAPSCGVVAERELPLDSPYNGLLILSDGNLITRNLGFRADDRAGFIVLEPERLRTVAELEIPERCMARFSCDRSADREYVYFTTPSQVRRLIYRSGRLELDLDWAGSYEMSGDQSDAWDTTIGSDSVWLMDMGRPPAWLGRATAPQRAFRFSIENPSDRDVLDVIGRPGAWNPSPPTYDPTRQILVHFDSINRRVVAHRYQRAAPLRLLWERPFRNLTQMIVWLDTGELVVEDSSSPDPVALEPSADAVLVDIETGSELGRAPIGAAATTGMFCSPGFGRDFYVCSMAGSVARIYVE